MIYKDLGEYKQSTSDLKRSGVQYICSANRDESIKSFSLCYDLRDKIKNYDLIYSGIALLLLTSDRDMIPEIKKIQIEDDTLRGIFHLTLNKIFGDEISEGIMMLESEVMDADIIVLQELLKISESSA